MTRNELKSIVKECLIEILQEGISPESFDEQPETSRKLSRARSQTLRSGQKRRRGPALPPPSMGGQVQNENFDRNVAHAAKTLSDNPVMESIFSDTAKTTLQVQNSEGHNMQTSPGVANLPPGVSDGMIPSPMSGPVLPVDPLNIPGAGNWAELAFAEPKLPGRPQI